ncbi:MAG: hypothetical protein K8F91_16585 [Candidatus Obscuribacterales bacterium]|nr:hypothetical protein [Candidatus Obscuribacterales bacterium]
MFRYTQFLLTLSAISCLPALAHDGSAAQHLLLGLDAGIITGTVIGFVAGAMSTVLFLKNKKESHRRK